MKVTVIGSGSRGNSVAIHSRGATLLVDAGFGARTVLKRLEERDVSPGEFVGVVLTHEHGDHVRGAASVAKKFRCPVFGSAGTLKAADKYLRGLDTYPLTPLKDTAIGDFAVTSCTTTHDAAEPVSIAVRGSHDCRVGIAHDIGRATAALKFMLKGVQCLIVESNYDEIMLRSGPYPPSVQQRIAGSSGHLSNRAAGALASEICHPGLQHVVLAHLSEKCNAPDVAHETVLAALRKRGFRGKLTVATQERATGPLKLVGPNPQLELEAV